MGVRVLPMVNTPSWVQWVLATLTSASMRRNCEICWHTVVPLQGKNGALPSRKKTLAQIKSLGVLATAPYEFLFYSVDRVDLRQMGKIHKYIYIYICTNPAYMKSVYIYICIIKYVCILWHLGVDFGLHMHMYIPACLPSNKEKWATRGSDIAKTMWKLPHSSSYVAKIEKQNLKYFFRIIVPNCWKNIFFFFVANTAHVGKQNMLRKLRSLRKIRSWQPECPYVNWACVVWIQPPRMLPS